MWQRGSGEATPPSRNKRKHFAIIEHLFAPTTPAKFDAIIQWQTKIEDHQGTTVELHLRCSRFVVAFAVIELGLS